MTNTEAITKLTNIMHDDHYSWHPSILTAFNMAVDALKGADGDCISREGLKENLLSEDYETHDYCFPCKEIMKRIDELPSAQPTHNNTSNALKSLDCIDRQAAIDRAVSIPMFGRDVKMVAVSEIKNLPSAQPERKRGKWNFIGDQMFECTECGVCYTQNQFHQMRVRITDPEFPNFCPNCGADMRGGQDGSD